MSSFTDNKFIRLFFFNHHFYGLCAVALSVEASLQQHQALNSLLFYMLIYACTVAYYSQASLQTEFSDHAPNIRSHWYKQHKTILLTTQYLLYAFICVTLLILLVKHITNLLQFSAFEWLTLLIFPLLAFLYYGLELKYFGRYTLRTVGWLKPLVIGFTWAGLVTIYPVMYSKLEQAEHYAPGPVSFFLFVKNFMYITLLSILFDIKDYSMDHNAQLKTIVIKLGLRKTLFYLIVPFCLIGLGSFYVYAFSQQFSLQKMLINTIPFLLILRVTYSLSSRKSIFYYLIIIDGLMLVKAACGIIAMLYF